MAECLHPHSAWQCGHVICKSDGVISPRLVFSASEALRYYSERYGASVGAVMVRDNAIQMPCGKCLACEMRKRKEINVRLTNEASVASDCCFITLTYNDENVVKADGHAFNRDRLASLGRGEKFEGNLTLFPKDVQSFLKRLRRHLEYLPESYTDWDKEDVVQPSYVNEYEVFRHGGVFYQKIKGSFIVRDHVPLPIRYFCVGEYGGNTKRPHYHILIFGWKPSDMKLWKRCGDSIMCRSPQIEKLWKFGFSSVEEFGAGHARYVSRYVTKKMVSLAPPSSDVCPEFFLQSVRKGGIGAPWFDKNYEAIMSRGFITLNENGTYINYAMPQYYWRRLRYKNLSLWLQLRDEKLQFVSSNRPNVDIGELMCKCATYEYKGREMLRQDLL